MKKLENEINLLLENKEELEGEIEESKWKLEKADQNYQELKEKYNQGNDEILTLNENIINSQERIRRLIEDNNEQEHAAELLKNEKEILTER